METSDRVTVHRTHTILEAVCSKCGDIFNPCDEADTIHIARDDGSPCEGEGTIVGEWVFRR